MAIIGAFTAQELELNKKLYNACTTDPPNFREIESLLKQGAHPLGAMAERPQWGQFAFVYDELLDSQDSCEYLPQITELFLKYGMDIDNPPVPYDYEENMNPMWSFAFVMNQNSAPALKMLLDHGLSADSARKMWGHEVDDLGIYHMSPLEESFWNDAYTWLMKHIMLCASYDHVINNDADLRKLIDYDSNDYDLHKFRAWDDFSYEFEASDKPNWYVVKIFEKASGKEVWRYCV